jgi:hypothetical protein
MQIRTYAEISKTSRELGTTANPHFARFFSLLPNVPKLKFKTEKRREEKTENETRIFLMSTT